MNAYLQKAREDLQKLFEEHGLTLHQEDGWLCVDGNSNKVHAAWYPNEWSGIYEVKVKNMGFELIESFGGVGEGEKGYADGLQNFVTNSLHVILAAFFGIVDENQVAVEQWEIDGTMYDMYLGPYGSRLSTEHIEPPENYIDEVESAIKKIKELPDIVWFRTFYCNVNDEKHMVEALYNNNEWGEPGINSIKALDWPVSKNYYSIRNFIVGIKKD